MAHGGAATADVGMQAATKQAPAIRRTTAGGQKLHSQEGAQHIPLLSPPDEAADRNKAATCRPEQVVQNGRMPLPIQPLPMVERWDCHQCGVCCRGSIVPLSDDDLARLKSQKWEERPEFQGHAVVVRESWLGRLSPGAPRADGSCVFLMPDGLCRIHKELGFDAKPLVCRMFPLQIVPRDNVAYVTIRRACPSAAADKGRPVAEQLEFARKLARERHLADAAAAAAADQARRAARVARRSATARNASSDC